MAKVDMDSERVVKETPDILGEQTERLRELYPEAFSEGKVDWEKLRAILGDSVEERPERYSFTWAGKRDAIRLLQTPRRATLIPAKEESVDFGSTRHLFIEGDNLEVLKLLYKAYFGSVKMIYIDPPYNTGSDFIYPDNYTDPLDTYLKISGQKDADGNLLTSNPETSGRYHSTWLSMMYPRLFLARQLLRDDGVIFISIDDHEVHNLRLLMNEVFGEENFVAQLVWDKGRKNDAKLFSVGHEYLVVFAKSISKLREHDVVWREEKPGAKEIWDAYLALREQHGSNDAEVEGALKDWYRCLPEGHPSKALSRYKHVDKFGPWRDRDISWPGGGGPRYVVIHPKTQKPCAIPERGWGFSTQAAMEDQIQKGLVVFREDHTKPPIRKAHLYPVLDELCEDETAVIDEEENGQGVGLQVMPSYIYRQSQVSVRYLRKLMGAKVFDNPKDHEVIARMISYCTSKDDTILDFFAGSCSTAQAVLEVNSEDEGNRCFIMVQLPEPLDLSKTLDDGTELENIADIGKERIRRVVAKMKEENEGKLDLSARETPEDLGFKVFKLAESNFKQWPEIQTDDPEVYAEQLAIMADPMAAGWTVENVIYEAALKEGYDLNCRIEKVEGIAGNDIYLVRDEDKGQSFRICLDEIVSLDNLKPLGLTRDDLFVCRDRALDDEAAANLALQCRLKTI